jgi:hypothetical protein
LNACVLGVEVEEQIGLPVPIDIFHRNQYGSSLGSRGTKAGSSRIDGRGIESVCRQDGHGDFPFALGIDGGGVAAGFDVDGDYFKRAAERDGECGKVRPVKIVAGRELDEVDSWNPAHEPSP